MTDAKSPPTPLPSATILLLRDGAHGIEVFMVKRHHQIDFASGALVFPGGKVDVHDRDQTLRKYADGADKLDDLHLSLIASAIREGFEESGILLARKSGHTDYIDAAAATALAPWRPKLNDGEVGLAEFLAKEDLRLACDTLVPFAHWVTPVFMPKRFDTYFYLAATPAGQLGRHDGSESVDSVWIDPHEAIEDTKRWTVIFPTKMNLLKLAKSKTVAEALARAKADPIVTVEPKVEQRGTESVMTIPENAGYGKIEISMKGFKG
jgi:8-oxo-dGTP pyrophosphatase MutT (NUDIX family)